MDMAKGPDTELKPYESERGSRPSVGEPGRLPLKAPRAFLAGDAKSAASNRIIGPTEMLPWLTELSSLGVPRNGLGSDGSALTNSGSVFITVW